MSVIPSDKFSTLPAEILDGIAAQFSFEDTANSANVLGPNMTAIAAGMTDYVRHSLDVLLFDGTKKMKYTVSKVFSGDPQKETMSVNKRPVTPESLPSKEHQFFTKLRFFGSRGYDYTLNDEVESDFVEETFNELLLLRRSTEGLMIEVHDFGASEDNFTEFRSTIVENADVLKFESVKKTADLEFIAGGLTSERYIRKLKFLDCCMSQQFLRHVIGWFMTTPCKPEEVDITGDCVDLICPDFYESLSKHWYSVYFKCQQMDEWEVYFGFTISTNYEEKIKYSLLNSAADSSTGVLIETTLSPDSPYKKIVKIEITVV